MKTAISSERDSSSLESLPDELLSNICQSLSNADIHNVILTSGALYGKAHVLLYHHICLTWHDPKMYRCWCVRTNSMDEHPTRWRRRGEHGCARYEHEFYITNAAKPARNPSLLALIRRLRARPDLASKVHTLELSGTVCPYAPEHGAGYKLPSEELLPLRSDLEDLADHAAIYMWTDGMRQLRNASLAASLLLLLPNLRSLALGLYLTERWPVPFAILADSMLTKKSHSLLKSVHLVPDEIDASDVYGLPHESCYSNMPWMHRTGVDLDWADMEAKLFRGEAEGCSEFQEIENGHINPIHNRGYQGVSSVNPLSLFRIGIESITAFFPEPSFEFSRYPDPFPPAETLRVLNLWFCTLSYTDLKILLKSTPKLTDLTYDHWMLDDGVSHDLDRMFDGVAVLEALGHVRHCLRRFRLRTTVYHPEEDELGRYLLYGDDGSCSQTIPSLQGFELEHLEVPFVTLLGHGSRSSEGLGGRLPKTLKTLHLNDDLATQRMLSDDMDIAGTEYRAEDTLFPRLMQDLESLDWHPPSLQSCSLHISNSCYWSGEGLRVMQYQEGLLRDILGLENVEFSLRRTSMRDFFWADEPRPWIPPDCTRYVSSANHPPPNVC